MILKCIYKKYMLLLKFLPTQGNIKMTFSYCFLLWTSSENYKIKTCTDLLYNIYYNQYIIKIISQHPHLKKIQSPATLLHSTSHHC